MNNWDRIKTLDAIDFSNVFWQLLDHSKGYTDSREWLLLYLMKEENPDENKFIFRQDRSKIQ